MPEDREQRARRSTSPDTPSSKGVAVWLTVRAWIEMRPPGVRRVEQRLNEKAEAVVVVHDGPRSMDDVIKVREDPMTTAARVISALAGA